MLCASVILAVGISLIVLASFATTEVTAISTLGSDDGFKHFRVRGRVTRTYLDRTPYKDSDVYSFTVVDDSVDENEGLKIKVDGPVYYKLKDLARVPHRGDLVDVEGTLYAGDGFRLLALNHEMYLTLLEAAKEAD